MFPAASICGLFLAHPEADYFNVGLLQRDQIVDYARRKGLSELEIETWLASRLAYDPEVSSKDSSHQKESNVQ